MSSLHDTQPDLSEILQHGRLLFFFQPIVDFSRQNIIGYECLARGPAGTSLHSPEALLARARANGHGAYLERLCLRDALYHAQRLKLKNLLFVNFDLTVFEGLFADEILALLKNVQIAPERLVLELSGTPADIKMAKENAHACRAAGIGIALDRVGDGGLHLWEVLKPDYIKIDRHFCRDLQNSPRRREFLRMLRTLAQRISTRVIAQGIETAEIYQELCSLEFELGQGYYFAKPQASPPRHIPQCLFRHDALPPVTRFDTIACLAIERRAVLPDMSVAEVGELFHHLPDVYSLPVINQNQVPLGIVRRHDIMQLLLGRYGHELHGRKRIHILMDNEPLIFDSALSLEDASRQVTTYSRATPEHDFIITGQGRYRGIGRVMDLLRHITELQMRNARYANPLTLLPGNVPIQEHLETLLREKAEFVVAYCDLDNFKPFNDVYGYDCGDEVIKTLGRILLKYAIPPDFVGHVGGDDFIVIFRCRDWETRCRHILDEFDALAHSFYSAEDHAKGGIYTQDRSGTARFFDFLSVSVGVVQPDPRRCHSHHEIAALATEAKHQAKQGRGSCLFIDRRRAPLSLPANQPYQEHADA